MKRRLSADHIRGRDFYSLDPMQRKLEKSDRMRDAPAGRMVVSVSLPSLAPARRNKRRLRR